MFNQRVLKKFGDELIKDVQIPRLKASTEVANEFFDAVIQRDKPKTGYEEFGIQLFEGPESALDGTVLERVQDKLLNVKDFGVARM